MSEGASSEPQDEAPASPSSATPADAIPTPWLRHHGLIVICVLLLLAGLVVVFDPGKLPWRTSGSPAAAPTSGGVDRAARVLVLIDVSGSMKRDLNEAAPAEGSRIANAVASVITGIKSLTVPGDRVGVWLFSGSDNWEPRECRRAARMPEACELLPIGPVEEVTSGELRRLQAVRANYGGTPLHKTIGAGALALREDASRSDGPSGAISSLIVITDGIEHVDAPGNSIEDLKRGASAHNDVQVLMTASEEGLCQTELRNAIPVYYPWLCVDASSRTKAIIASNRIMRRLG